MSGFLKLVAIVFVAGIFACIFILARVDLNAKESTLLSIILTIVSILASWLVSHIYSESQHKQAIQEVQELHRSNLRTYALKAAEKVNNLSNELNRLVLYLEQALSVQDLESSDEALLAKEERISGAIHIANTLKSVNDTSLSDWRGVIGEELEQQREQQEEREEELRDLMLRVEFLENYQEDVTDTPANTQALKTEIDSLKAGLRTVVASLSGSPLTPRYQSRPKRQDVELRCPNCSELLTYRQKPKQNSSKSLKCSSCNKQLISKYDTESGYSLKQREIVSESIQCPNCGTASPVLLDSAPGSSTVTGCPSCANSLRVFRSNAKVGVRVIEPISKSVSAPAALNEDLIDRVSANLPPQPWPDGIHKRIAQILGVSTPLVQSAIKELIRRGMFKHQIDGVLYVPVEVPQPSQKSS